MRIASLIVFALLILGATWWAMGQGSSPTNAEVVPEAQPAREEAPGLAQDLEEVGDSTTRVATEVSGPEPSPMETALAGDGRAMSAFEGEVVRVTGTVLDQDGKPLEGTRIQLQGYQWP